MSKILDILRQENHKSADAIQEQLAEIYISPTKKKKLPGKKMAKFKEVFLRNGWFWLVLFLSIIAASSILLLFSSNKIYVNIAFVREESPLKTNLATAGPESIAGNKTYKNVGSLPLNTLEFGGSAATESRLTESYLYLVNSRGAGWAAALINFDEPVNLTDKKISFLIKGERGGEHLFAILKDASNKTYQAIDIAPAGLSKDWQNITIRLKEASQWISLASVSQIRLEFGNATANNPISSTIYIKDFNIN